MDRTILIVGASSGIGLECARLFRDDEDIVINISRTECPLEQVANFCADVTEPERLEAQFADLADRIEGIDVLLWFAGFSMAAPTEFVSEEDVRTLFETNFFGFWRLAKLALPRLKPGGKIFLASSTASPYPILYDGFYSASKSALETLGRELRAELAPSGVTVTSVRIGGTRTEFTYKRKVYEKEQSGEYFRDQTTACENLARIEQHGMSPEAVAKHFFRLSKRGNPPWQSTPGLMNKAAVFARRLLPDRFMMFLSRKRQMKNS